MLKSNVIDIRTTIKVLSPNLSKDHRQEVIVKFTEILSIVATFKMENQEFLDFRKATLQGNFWAVNTIYFFRHIY